MKISRCDCWNGLGEIVFAQRLLDCLPQSWQLPSADNGLMAGQDLLNQRRARSRHANDEEGPRFTALFRAFFRLHHWWSECCLDPSEQIQHRSFIVGQFPPLDHIADQQVLSRAFRLPHIIQCFCQRKMQQDAF